MSSTQHRTEVATIGGGCFWCVEAVFQEVEGVEKVASGYAGGSVPNPSYREVCAGTTGHAEVVQITFDPDAISYKEILEIFFATHDPTTLDRQGADVGTQYRSIVLYHDEAQKETAERLIMELTEERLWNKPIVTQVEPLEKFYPAEDYHQNYYRTNPAQAYCAAVISPKLSKFRQRYQHRLRQGI